LGANEYSIHNWRILYQKRRRRAATTRIAALAVGACDTRISAAA